MPSFSGWSNLESFLTSTTPSVTSPYLLSSLTSAFKVPCAFGVEVKLTQDETIYYLPTLSAISVKETQYFETAQPHLRPTAYHKLEELNITEGPDANSWMALLWIPINKVPPGRVYGNVLVYYNLHAETSGYLKLHGLLLFKIPLNWTHVYKNDEELNRTLTNHWTDIRDKLFRQATNFHTSLKRLHHDFNFIASREKQNYTICEE